MAPRLTSLGDQNGPASRPGYVPETHGAGIVHLGFGAFHRAHQAVMTDDALAEDGGDWRIIGVSLRSKNLAEDLNAQNGLYTLIEKDGRGTSARVIGAVDHVIAADPTATLDALSAPNIRIVTLTVTEKGYAFDPATRRPDPSNPSVAADLATPDAPSGVLGLLTAAIKRRKTQGAPPLTLLSCDNLPENGRLLCDAIVGFAHLSGQDGLADWIAANIAFPSSMVDRITPATTEDALAEARTQTGCEDRAAVETEPFLQWVIEDNFPTGRPKWEAGGALFVADVTPYERMKLTMLNGSHSLLAYTGFLLGRRYVRDVMRDADLRWLIQRHLAAAASLLPPLHGVDFDTYARALEGRFINPAIAHETFQIATDATQKLPQRIFQPAAQALKAGQDVRPFAFAAAFWMRFCLGKTDDGKTYDLPDPRADELTQSLSNASTADAISSAIHALPNLIPPKLATNSVWRGLVETSLSSALQNGCRAAIQHEIAQEEPPRARA